MGDIDLKKSHSKEKIEKYLAIMLEYNKKVNIVSRKISGVQLTCLVNETLQLQKYISFENVIDAGSGNGILGFPIAISDQKKNITLVEPRKKKHEFLEYTKAELELKNVTVANSQIEEFFKSYCSLKSTLISRGFPDNLKLVSFLRKRIVSELIIVTSKSKIKKMEKGIEKFEQSIYNVAFRDNLKILQLKNVSRET